MAQYRAKTANHHPRAFAGAATAPRGLSFKNFQSILALSAFGFSRAAPALGVEVAGEKNRGNLVAQFAHESDGATHAACAPVKPTEEHGRPAFGVQLGCSLSHRPKCFSFDVTLHARLDGVQWVAQGRCADAGRDGTRKLGRVVAHAKARLVIRREGGSNAHVSCGKKPFAAAGSPETTEEAKET